MTRHIIIIALICLISITTACFAQDNASQNLYFAKKNSEVVFGAKDYQPSKKAFYIYRNCIYNVVLKDKRWVSMRVIDIRNDSIYYSPHFNAGEAAPNSERIDTLALHPRQLRKIKMIGDRIFGLYKNYSLARCRYVFEKGDTLKSFAPQTTISYSKDSTRSITYELVPYLTAQGLDMIYEKRGVSYYYEGMSPQVDEDTTPKKKPLPPKKWVWFTPTNVNKISGLNLGLQTMTVAENDSLTIHGMNISADMLTMFVSMYAIFYIIQSPPIINYPDTVDKTDMKSEIAGLSISGGGVIGDMRVRGVSINGGISSVIEMTGVQITGLSNTTKEFKGVVISGLANRAIRGRGLQVGLLNHCKNLKGIQLGLWNVNSKRSLPFINWDF